MAKVLSQMVSRISDFSLTGQKHQDVARLMWVAPEFIERVRNGLVHAVVTLLLKGSVAHFHWKSSTRDLDDGRGTFGRGKVFGKPLRVNGGRGDDDFEVWATWQNLAQIAQ